MHCLYFHSITKTPLLCVIFYLNRPYCGNHIFLSYNHYMEAKLQGQPLPFQLHLLFTIVNIYMWLFTEETNVPLHRDSLPKHAIGSFRASNKV